MSTTSSHDDEQRDLVVVGVDGSPSSLVALRWAAFQAAALRCELLAVRAWQDPLSYSAMAAGGMVMDPAWNEAQAIDKALVADVDAAFGPDRPLGLRTAVHQGAPTPVLLAQSRHARLLVLGSRGHGGFAGLMLGSVSATCAEHATCPVLVVHGDRVPDARP